MRIPIFNSPRAAFCTCLPKYNLNTYLGRCAHGCIYCYAVKFPSFVGPTSPRKRLLETIENMAKNTKPKLPVMMSDCTDPYQPLERKHKITRRCAEVLARHGFPMLIVTKSDLFVRDMDVFKRTPTVISVTITTLREDVAGFIEPNAPPPEVRLSAMRKAVKEGIPTVARVDPIIPTVNDDREGLEELVSALAEIGVRQVTASTLKPVRGFFSSLRKLNPPVYRRLFRLYADGERIMGYKYLPLEMRRRILRKLRSAVLRRGLDFALCREGLPELNTALCDGTQYCRSLLEKYVGFKQPYGSRPRL